MDSACDRRIVVVDRNVDPGDDRTWSFWGSSDLPFAHLADRRWDTCTSGSRVGSGSTSA
ncbi:MAG: hypothetical protein HRT86_04155 [Ilumatobacteraceae bacterium]|nr:hypothetical protein [Ilumatobacteraceae bacterium]